MLFGRKQPIPPPPAPEPDGLQFTLRLFSENLVKLLSIIVTLLFSSGLLVHSTSQGISGDAANTVEVTVQEDD